MMESETSADELNARVTIEVSGHKDEPKPEDEPRVADEEEETD